MKLDANVARTAYDLDHVNRLGVPGFGLLKLCLQAQGGSPAASKSYLPKDAPPPKAADAGSDDFHFAPEKEKIKIFYEIDDPYGLIDEAKLELFARFRAGPLWTLDLKKLGPDWYIHGKHTIEWDGRLPEQPDAEKAGNETDDGMEHSLNDYDAKEIKDVFPDGYVTLEFTPYKFRMTVGSKKHKGNALTAWTYFQILLKKIVLELGPEETVPAVTVDDDQHKRDKAVRRKIKKDGGLPAGAGTRKVFLISNLYKTSGAEMGNNTAFSQYQSLWGDGPNIPVLAKLRLSDSKNAEVKLESEPGAVALGRARFLWDWEDPDENVDAAQTSANPPKGFIKNAINYYKAGTDATRSAKDHTYPKGDNCHVDRDGKRGPDALPIFPDQAGYAPKDPLDAGKFPFKVEACKGRKWAAFSYGWSKGKLKGRTGVVFQPSRMAGDDYKLTVYLAYEKSKKDEFAFDERTEPLKAHADIKASTGKFQIWRQIHLARYVRKLNTINAFLPTNLGNVQAIYQQAYLNVEDKMGGDQYALSDHRKADGTAPDYNTLCRSKITAAGDVIFNYALDGAADHAGVDSAFKVRSYEDFVKAVHLDLHPGIPLVAGDIASAAGSLGITATQMAENLGTQNLSALPGSIPAIGIMPESVRRLVNRRTRLKATQLWLQAQNVSSRNDYCDYLDDKLMTIIETELASDLELISGGKVGTLTAAQEGITVLHFNYTNTYLRDLIASGGTPGSILGSAVDVSDASRNKCVFVFTFPALDTFVHEIGHHLFLPHTIAEGGPASRHDAADGNCMMSYNRPRPAFCGLCQLRLRGWDADALDKTSANNKKP